MDRKILKEDTSKQRWYCLISLQQPGTCWLDQYILCTGHSTSNAAYKKCCIKEEKNKENETINKNVSESKPRDD